MSLTKAHDSWLHSNPWARRTLLTLLVLLVLLALIRASLPFAIKVGASYWLESQQVEATIGDVEISFFNGSFAINDVSGENKSGKGFSLDHLGVAWQWKPFWNHQAIVDQIEIRSLRVDATFFDNGDMNIAGMTIKAATAETPVETTQSQATPWDATVKNIILSDVELCLQQFDETDNPVLDYCGKMAQFNWTGDASFKPSIQSEITGVAPLYVQGTLNIGDVALQNNQLKLALLSIGSIDVKDIKVETPDNINIENIDVAKFSALQRASHTSSADAQVFAFEQLNIQPLRLSQLNELALGKIEITNASSYLLINKDGHLDFEQWLPEKQREVAVEQKDSPKTAAKSFHYSFDEFTFTSNQHFTFVDDSLKETFTADIHNIELRLTKLDNKIPDSLSHISLALAIDKHGSFKLDADANPLSKRPSLKGKGEIAGLDLRMVAPMTKQYVGHNVKSGQLDADLKLDIDKGIIDSNMGLVLNQFEFESLSNEEAKELNSDFGFPLSTSLSLLRDRDNAIRLDIPVSGDIDNPEFDPKDAIVKASSSAITAAVLHYYTPFGLIFAAESLLDLATALNFDPVLSEAGEAKLNAIDKEQLDKIASLMTERPGIHLTLCGISNSTDKDKLFPKPIETADKKQETEKQESEVTIEPLSKENTATLKQLAESRSAIIKNYLVNEKTVKASRLIECSPEYIDDDISGVKISI